MSTLRLSNIANAGGTESVPVADVIHGTARAWVNFNGTGVVAIRASYNVSSITDNGVGDYTLNFATPMADANYAASLATTIDICTINAATFTTTALRIAVYTRATALTLTDPPIACAGIFR